MHKKLMMACLAIAAFAAFVIAPAASAAKLTENGVLVPVHPAGKTCGEDPTGCFIATNTGITKFTSAISLECSTAHLTGEVTDNGGVSGIVKGIITKTEGANLHKDATFEGTGTGGDCTSGAGAAKVTVKSDICLETATDPGPPQVDTIKATGCGGNIVFTFLFTESKLDCEYSVASITATYTTNTSPTPVVVSEQPAKKIAGGVLCPSEGKLDMTFDLYTDNLPTETPLTISP